MIVVLDPALFLPPHDDIGMIIDDACRVCRRVEAQIPAIEPYWTRLQHLMRSLDTASPRLHIALRELRRYARHASLDASSPAQGLRMWGVKPLFAWSGLDGDWLDIMTSVLLGVARTGQPPLLLTRLFEGRNLTTHAVEKSTVEEKTRWRLYVQAEAIAPFRIDCVRNVRNLEVPWTTRFDERLPDAGRFPFCPPARWWRRDVVVRRTIEGKPAWIDTRNSGWAQPATGGHLHWDVFLRQPAFQELVGVSQINVTAWGTTETGKKPGDFHHIPEEKKPHVNQEASWTCL